MKVTVRGEMTSRDYPVLEETTIVKTKKPETSSFVAADRGLLRGGGRTYQ